MTSEPSRPTLHTLQALRGLAASAVVFEHLHFHSEFRQGPGLLPDWFDAGHLGVDLFFVLSGFIIPFVHGADIGHAQRLPAYLWRRFVRVWPLLVLLTTAKLAYIVLDGPGADEADPSLALVLTTYLCLPHPDLPLLQVAWTLRHEVLFYALFGFAIAGGPRVSLGLLLSTFLLLVAALVFGPWNWWADFLCSPLHFHFLFGLFVAWRVRRDRPGPVLLWGLAFSSLIVMAIGGAWHLQTGKESARILVAVGAAALVYVAVAWERARPRHIPAGLKLLGDASYSLYLLHGTVIALGLYLWPKLTPGVRAHPYAYLLAVTALAFASSIALYRWVEAPWIAHLRTRGPGRSNRTVSESASAET